MTLVQRSALITGLLALVLAGGVPRVSAGNPWGTDWEPRIPFPAYPLGNGPVVVVDEAHFNFHTINGRYQNFARVLERDGYSVHPGKTQFSLASLRETRMLVVATPLAERNREPSNWSPPIATALSAEEIKAVREWARSGGSLLLIADHLPFAGAAEMLAAAFGFDLINGYALDRREIQQATLDRPFIFARNDKTRRDGALADHPITRGSNPTERVDRVMTFMGAAIRTHAPVSPLLVFGNNISTYQTETFGRLSAATPSIPASGLMQAAARRFGKGRVVIFAEAGLFGAQWQAGKPVGMNHPEASGNLQILLNTMHWLDGSLK